MKMYRIEIFVRENYLKIFPSNVKEHFPFLSIQDEKVM